ncbi:hypothetical protein [Actinomadura gamaensis]|uniref:LPXTG cell wall anchor domain-containing protein n=1 Tax=Actinomadura gamaensis TaxID=1763541 RepID=A0ABV9TSJ7_9ACTN
MFASLAAALVTGALTFGAPAPAPTGTGSGSGSGSPPTVTPTSPTTSPTSPTGSPTKTAPPTTSPTGPAVSVNPTSVTTEPTPLSIQVACPGGTLGAHVSSSAFGTVPAKGESEVGTRTRAGLAPGRYIITLTCSNGRTASTSLEVVGAGGSPRPTPTGAPRTGGGSTSRPDAVLYLTGLALLGIGAAGGVALRRRGRNGG